MLDNLCEFKLSYKVLGSIRKVDVFSAAGQQWKAVSSMAVLAYLLTASTHPAATSPLTSPTEVLSVMVV